MDPNRQTDILPDGSRQSAYLKGEPPKEFLFEDARTLYQGIRRGAKISGDSPMLGARVMQDDGSEPYVWQTYNQVLERADNLSLGFRELSIPVGNNVNMDIYARNRPEWIITELATYNYSNVLVPIYDTLGSEACSFIINQTEMEIIICDDMKKTEGLVTYKKKCPKLLIIVVIKGIPNQLKDKARTKNIRLLTFDELEDLGKRSTKSKDHIPPRPEDLATICYTSGTTGAPKGVMLTHGNVVAATCSGDYLVETKLVTEDITTGCAKNYGNRDVELLHPLSIL